MSNLFFYHKESWKKIEHEIRSRHIQQVNEINERKEKRLHKQSERKRQELQPTLDFVIHQRKTISDKHLTLEEEVKALRIKHLFALGLMDKLKRSFEYFVLETQHVSSGEAKQMVIRFLQRQENSEKQLINGKQANQSVKLI